MEASTELRTSCAYNRTRECFLGLEIAVGEFNSARLIHCMDRLTSNSGCGIWMVPFRGIREDEVTVPLDLIYLDEECKVIETVEFFPTLLGSKKSQSAASLLALPAHTIAVSHTEPGDQILLAPPEEMSSLLEEPVEKSGSEQARKPSPRAANSKDASGSFIVGRPQSERGRDTTSHGKESKKRATHPPGGSSQEAPKERPAERPGRIGAPPKSWLERWLFPGQAEPRIAERLPAAGLTVHFWTGGLPQAFPVRDISATGLFVETTERWYPGTLIRMTLSKPDPGHEPAQCSIVLHCRAVWCGDDGVGVEFVFEGPKRGSKPIHPSLGPVDAKHLEAFLKRYHRDPENQ